MNDGLIDLIFRGNASLSSDQTTLLVDNLTKKTFDVYHVPTKSLAATLVFSALPATQRYTKQCTFSEGSEIAVCGSTTNMIYVVDMAANEVLQKLTAGDGTILHPIA